MSASGETGDRMMQPRLGTSIAAFGAVLVTTAMTGAAHAACPIELAVYTDRHDVASIDFVPAGELAAVTNRFSMAMREGARFDGHVLWTDEPERPYGHLMHDCPEGDLTGEEIRACTLWQGAIYAVDEDGQAGLLPAEGEPAPAVLILSDLGYQMSVAPAFQAAGPLTPPFDVFSLSGCQE